MSNETSSTVQPGNVISQSPQGGTDAAPGSTVAITVAKAPPTVVVPPVVGDSRPAAVSALNAAGFRVTHETVTVSDQSKSGIVISQSPGGGSRATQGHHRDDHRRQVRTHQQPHDHDHEQLVDDHVDDQQLDDERGSDRQAQTMTHARVAVLAGGRSSEHEVSLASAASVSEGLADAGYEVSTIDVGRDGVWRRDGELMSLVPGTGLPGHDVVFPVLHGPFGEDGTVQGLLECLDVPYVGAGVLASAQCMHKVVFKELMAQAGIPQVQYRAVDSAEFASVPDEVRQRLATLGLPVFVKPARLGSSVGNLESRH